MRKLLEGSRAVAEAVRLCEPQVIAAYPITPQTHIIEHLAQFVADAELHAEFINAESEFGAISIVQGAVAAGSRAFTASASQGLLLMTEVLFNIAGMRLPVVMVCANRAVSAPINIFCDHQDSMSVRDAGWIQLYVETNQEAMDSIVQAYYIAEHCELPVMLCMDGFLLTHTFEPVELLDQDTVKSYLPTFTFNRMLSPDQPHTLGAGSEPENYLEYRYAQHQAMDKSATIVTAAGDKFAAAFGRSYGLLDCYFSQDVETVFVTLGSAMGVVRDVVDTLRAQGESVGAVRLRCFRPFPAEALLAKLEKSCRVIVLEKAFSCGASGIVATELRAALQLAGVSLLVHGYICGLGGRDLTCKVVENIYQQSLAGPIAQRHGFAGINVTSSEGGG